MLLTHLLRNLTISNQWFEFINVKEVISTADISNCAQ